MMKIQNKKLGNTRQTGIAQRNLSWQPTLFWENDALIYFKLCGWWST